MGYMPFIIGILCYMAALSQVGPGFAGHIGRLGFALSVIAIGEVSIRFVAFEGRNARLLGTALAVMALVNMYISYQAAQMD